MAWSFVSLSFSKAALTCCVGFAVFPGVSLPKENPLRMALGAILERTEDWQPVE
jgi:hypothetical protein